MQPDQLINTRGKIGLRRASGDKMRRSMNDTQMSRDMGGSESLKEGESHPRFRSKHVWILVDNNLKVTENHEL